jgi:hypothetical protein
VKKVIAIVATLCIFQILAWLAIKFDIETLIIPADAVLPDGSVYYGELLDGKFHGQGKLLGTDGSRYEGEFSKGLRSGRGEWNTSWGDVYTGEFKEGVMTGQGELRMKDGTVYSGAFLNNLPHGQGVLTRQNGVRYQGEFAQWEFHGKGVYVTPEGEEYSGDFIEGEFTGAGSYKDAEGNRYEGAFLDWEFHGTGTYTAIDGKDSRRGEWQHGEFQDPRDEQREKLLRELMEQALYRQDVLLQNAVQALAPGTPGVIDLYFVGLAGYGQQDVFMKELEYIHEQFETRYGAAGRATRLINNLQTLDRIPLATRTGLERTLRGVAGKMNIEEDILFLYLTSHGTADHLLAISHPAVKLPAVSPQDLKLMLQALPIKWKVIVISACYAGGFIPSLRDDNTLVITAASAERKSFGCSDTSEITWFAKAYFKESLPQATSFEQAFENARTLIADWEQLEVEKGGAHSEPQMAAGKAASRQLHKWWQSRPMPQLVEPPSPADAETLK